MCVCVGRGWGICLIERGSYFKQSLFEISWEHKINEVYVLVLLRNTLFFTKSSNNRLIWWMNKKRSLNYLVFFCGDLPCREEGGREGRGLIERGLL